MFRTVTGDTSDGVGSGFLDPFSLQGKDECSARTAIRSIDHLEVAAGANGQAAGDAQAEPGAVAAAGLESGEPLEDALPLVLRRCRVHGRGWSPPTVFPLEM